MHSVEGRVRYRGDLQDPNEVALVIAVGGISMFAAFIQRKRDGFFRFGATLAIAVCVAAVMLTKSRGGQVAMLLVFFVYMVKRYRFKAFIPAALMAIPLLMFGGRDDGGASDQSTMERYEAWSKGLDLFGQSPIYGVGAGQFVEHHYLTAHNSFVLSLAELGFVGLVLFVAMIYLRSVAAARLDRASHVPARGRSGLWHGAARSFARDVPIHAVFYPRTSRAVILSRCRA